MGGRWWWQGWGRGVLSGLCRSKRWLLLFWGVVSISSEQNVGVHFLLSRPLLHFFFFCRDSDPFAYGLYDSARNNGAALRKLHFGKAAGGGRGGLKKRVSDGDRRRDINRGGGGRIMHSSFWPGRGSGLSVRRGRREEESAGAEEREGGKEVRVSFSGHRGLLEVQEEPLINYDHYYHHLCQGH